MTLGDDLTATLPYLREQAESMMISTCTIALIGSEPTLNEQTGNYESTSQTIYTGPCRLKFGATQANVVDAQAQLVNEQAATLSIPVNADGSSEVTTNHVATITANPLDEGMVGKTWRILGVHFQTTSTARRFPVEILS